MTKKQQEHYAVEKLVKHRILKRLAGSTKYDHIEILVKWEGYAPIYNTWEPLSTLYKDVASLCRKYFKEKGMQLNSKITNFGALIIIIDNTNLPITRRFTLTPIPNSKGNSKKIKKSKTVSQVADHMFTPADPIL